MFLQYHCHYKVLLQEMQVAGDDDNHVDISFFFLNGYITLHRGKRIKTFLSLVLIMALSSDSSSDKFFYPHAAYDSVSTASVSTVKFKRLDNTSFLLVDDNYSLK